MAQRRRTQLLAAAVLAAAALSGCGSDPDADGPERDQQPARSRAERGGTLLYLDPAVVEHLDPQRVYVARDIANLGRLVYRSWVAFPPGETDPEAGAVPQPDLATDAGRSNEDATQWSFTLKDGPRWQDGQPVTCEDFRYGLSRTFATDVITGGPSYALGYLDVPTAEDGSSAYEGPYTQEGQELFDRAVTCDGATITYRFNKPWPDFPRAIAALRAFDPYRADQDRGERSDLEVFSNGPYVLDGAGWDKDTGGRFVRNPEWDAAEDALREANPDEVTFELGASPEVIIDRLVADDGEDQAAVAAVNVTAPQFPQITGEVAERAVSVESPFTEYLVPNHARITNPAVRQALAAATDRAAYVGALGGDRTAVPALSVVSPLVPGYRPVEAFGTPEGGDVDTARALLEDSGETLPYPIRLTYPTGSQAFEKAMAALKEGYDAAGFEVTLEGLDPSGPYYDAVDNPDGDSDLVHTGWGADWPSMSTVIPPLFDSRRNLTEDSNGNDFGNYASDEVNAAIDAALTEPELTAADEQWAALDQVLAQDVAYIPLDVYRFFFLHGSRVQNYVLASSTARYPDLGVISIGD